MTGFSDGEACFTVSVYKDSQRKLGWRVSTSFQIGLDAKDKVLWDRIQAIWGFFWGERSSSFLFFSLSYPPLTQLEPPTTSTFY